MNNNIVRFFPFFVRWTCTIIVRPFVRLTCSCLRFWDAAKKSSWVSR